MSRSLSTEATPSSHEDTAVTLGRSYKRAFVNRVDTHDPARLADDLACERKRNIHTYTLLLALRKQDFKARRSFLADSRNHGRFLSSTSQHKTLSSATCDGTAKSRDCLPSIRTERSRFCHCKFWPQGRQPERDQLIMRGSNQCILRVTAQKPAIFSGLAGRNDPLPHTRVGRPPSPPRPGRFLTPCAAFCLA